MGICLSIMEFILVSSSANDLLTSSEEISVSEDQSIAFNSETNISVLNLDVSRLNILWFW